MSNGTVTDTKRIFELEDATTGDGLLVLYLAVDHPNFAEAKRVLVGSMPAGSGGGGLPATIMLNDGTVAFTASITGVAGTAPTHLAVTSQVDTAAAAAAAAQTAAEGAQQAAEDAQDSANSAATTAGAAMPKAGGAFTGAVTVQPAVANSNPATLLQLNDAIAAIPPSTGGGDPATAAPLAPGTAAVGVSAKYAREDHVHPAQAVPTASSATPAAAGTAAAGSSTSFSRADHVHPAQTVPAAGNLTPNAPGVADPGDNATFARSDHIHPLQDVSALMPKAGGTFTGPVVVPNATAADQPASKGQLDAAIAGVPAGPAPSSATPTTAGTAAAGSATTYARGDHVHGLQPSPAYVAGDAVPIFTVRRLTQAEYLALGTPNANTLYAVVP